MKKTQHESVLLKESVDLLSVKKDQLYVDATVGAAGHTKEIVRRGGKVIGFEVDPATFKWLNEEKLEIKLLNKNFSKISESLREAGITKVSGVLFDLGISSDQLADPSKGLSFNLDSPLDMRLDPLLGVRAADLINALGERELYELFKEYGEEHFARSIARAIVNARRKEKFETTRQLATLVERVVGRKRSKIHPATRVFMALRIVVNDEINNLKKGLEGAVEVLEDGGRLVVISFHSLEDRLVKDFFATSAELKTLTPKPITASIEEIAHNARSRSAKLRAAEKI